MPRNKKTRSPFPDKDPLWFKDAIIYQLHVRAFQDSNGDGIGDFRGLRDKLDYLQDLGVTALWLLPFYPSPLRDDGYDTANYEAIHPDYGTLQDFKAFLQEAHRRGLRVITELVINHTSDQHPWFQRARRAPKGSPARNFYVWSDTQDRYRGTRIIFKDFEPSNWSWDSVAGAFYWHRFYSHQPDLNFENPEVHKAVLKVLDFWLGMGVDGLRLDAVPYLYEREGTSCENLPETHEFLKKLRAHVDAKFEDRMLLAEANQWPEDAVTYFGAGDECHMAFHFPLMPRLFMAVRMEDRFPIIDILQQTPAIPETSQWAVFLRNHDELTLEMVTDEDRDYMYRVYASESRARINLGIRRRLAPLLGNERRKIELLNGLLFSMPGTPIVYYGDEIGMGDNIYLGDRNGVRTPMQWSADRNAGFSRANPQKLYSPVVIDPEYHFESVNVEAMQNNTHSLLWWIKRLVGLRKRYRAFGNGTMKFLAPDNPKVLAFTREWRDERLLVVANLSRFTQYTNLELPDYGGMVPTELFGRSPFPVVTERPYFFTLGPHSFYWFSLERAEVAEVTSDRPAEVEPAITVEDSWVEALRGRKGAPVAEVLPRFLRGRRWFGAKGRKIVATRVFETIPLTRRPEAQMTLVRVEYTEGEPEHYTLPLAWVEGDEASRVREDTPQSIVARLDVRTRGASGVREGVLFDPMGDPRFSASILDAIVRRRSFKGVDGEIVASPTAALKRLMPRDGPPQPKPLKAEQSNTSVLFGGSFIFKLYRRVDAGINPDLEIGRFLTERISFPHVPPVAGFLEYRKPLGEPWTIGILQALVENEGDAWTYTLDALSRYFDRALGLSRDASQQELPVESRSLLKDAEEPPPFVQEVLGTYMSTASLLGERTAQLHVALSSDHEDPAFAAEAYPPHHQRSLYQSMRGLTRQSLGLLRRRMPDLPEHAREDAAKVLEHEEAIHERIKAILERRITAKRIRTHGDYHLGQVLNTGKDFVIIDFEGEPARSIGERRIKRSALRDVAGMLRSFHYASVFALAHTGQVRPEDVPALEPWARSWCHWVSAVFLRSYLKEAAAGDFLPESSEELDLMLRLYLTEKAVYELQYELNNRPDWVQVPLQGLLQLLAEQAVPSEERPVTSSSDAAISERRLEP